jgi:hypothetical protein
MRSSDYLHVDARAPIYDRSRVLDVPVEHFVGDIPTAAAARPPAAKKSPSSRPNPKVRREVLELVRAY